MDRQALERAVHLLGQFRPLDLRRGDPDQGRARQVPRLFGRNAASGRSSTPSRSRCWSATSIDISGLRSKHVSEFQAPGAPVMDFVFTVCDAAANEECAPWLGQPMTAHWGVADPVKATGHRCRKGAGLRAGLCRTAPPDHRLRRPALCRTGEGRAATASGPARRRDDGLSADFRTEDDDDTHRDQRPGPDRQAGPARPGRGRASTARSC